MANMRQLSGTVACPGKAQGQAVIIIKGIVQDLPEENKKYIIISDLTTPDIVPLMLKAEAIVTDIGGLSSHAANIAREFGIPCIVSTEYASKRINQGDLVWVNADVNQITWKADTSKCILCNKHPGLQILSSEHFYCIYDGYPILQKHLLVFPKQHIEHLMDLSSDIFYDLYSILKKIDNQILRKHGFNSYNIGINDGIAAGQTITHLHIHLIPRKHGDIDDPRGGIRNFFPNPLTIYP